MLGLSWELEKHGRTNEVPPGASLMLELWCDRTSSKRTVRIYLQTQTFEQIRRLTPLSLTTPPTRVPLVLSACVGEAGGAHCGWEQFRASVTAAIESRLRPADGRQRTLTGPYATGNDGGRTPAISSIMRMTWQL